MITRTNTDSEKNNRKQTEQTHQEMNKTKPGDEEHDL